MVSSAKLTSSHITSVNSEEIGMTPQASQDDLQRGAHGYVDEMPRQFSIVSLFSLAFSITNSWVGYSAVFITPLYVGGGPGVVYCLITACIACTFITTGLAELSSAFPTSGGQYHFAYMVASTSSRSFVAFSTGWLSVFAWLFTSASACIFCAQLTTNIAMLVDPKYDPTSWQIFLIYAGLIILCTVTVIYLPTALPHLETVFFLFSLLGFLVFLPTVLITTPSRQSATAIFKVWTNSTGWSDAVAFLIGTSQAMYTFLAVDSASHIAEETPHPASTVPKTMFLTVLLGLVTSFPWTLAFLLSTPDLDVLYTTRLVPIIEILSQTLPNKTAAVVFTTWFLAIYTGATLACIATTGRLIWAFARDNGLPFSSTFASVHASRRNPSNATWLTGGFCVVYGVLYVASTEAFNNFIATAILFLNLTYAIPQGIVLYRGRGETLPKARWLDLGWWFGGFCNGFSVVWVALFTVIFCFPIFEEVQAGSMNYVSVIVVGVGLFISMMWWWGGKKSVFSGPGQGTIVDGLALEGVMTNESCVKQKENKGKNMVDRSASVAKI